jgi:molybdopterin-guanine dinucleotide biosynthesis protein MobB
MPRLLSIVGRKHAGKTTLLVQLAAALRRRGHRIMVIKHGTHTFNLDPSNTDTYRHFHEGEAERVAMIAPDRFAMVARWSEELTPEAVAEQYMADADLVLCEGFKASTMPKIEVARRAAHAQSLAEAGKIDASRVLAFVTDTPSAFPGHVVFDLGDPEFLGTLADFVERWMRDHAK